MAKPFAVVEFEEENKKFVAVVSTSWLNDNSSNCAWPTGIGSHQKLVSHAKPDTNWLKFPCRVLKFCGKKFIYLQF
jgi:hypothetical protein